MASLSWFRWLRSLFSSPVKKLRKRSNRRLKLEHLEDRVVPTTFTWKGTSSTLWSAAANWTSSNPGAFPIPTNATINDLVFPATGGSKAPKNDIAGLNIDQITISTNSYNLSGAGITLGNASTGGGAINVNAGAVGENISMPIQLNGIGATGALDTITVGANGNLTLNGVAGQLGSPNSAGLTKSGTGTLTLTTDNSTSFTGAIDIKQGVLAITQQNALGNFGVATNKTTVDQNAQLQVNNQFNAPSFTVNEKLLLNGPGVNNGGALLNVTGTSNNNTWAGTITLDVTGTLVRLGAAAGSGLNITGQISDLGAGQNVTKEGLGQIIFSHVGGDTYRGSTTVNNGILTFTDPHSLGFATVKDSTGTLGAIVNSNPITNTSGTLQLAAPVGTTDPITGQAGFVVRNVQLTLNGLGFGGLGALDNFTGNNSWTGSVFIGSLIPNGIAPAIDVSATVNAAGVTTFSNLLLSGVVQDQAPSVNTANPPFNWGKSGLGRLVLSNANTYLGSAIVFFGELNVEDSQALGPTGKASATQVNAGASLELELQSDDIFNFFSSSPGVPAAPKKDSVTGLTNALNFSDPLVLNGAGVPVAQTPPGVVPASPNLTGPAQTAAAGPGLTGGSFTFTNGLAVPSGALHSISGVNIWGGTVNLASSAAIGVEPAGEFGVAAPAAVAGPSGPPESTTNSYFTNDYSLTIGPSGAFTGVISDVAGSTLSKVDAGQLILTAANTYTGPKAGIGTDIKQGWITAQNNLALGAKTVPVGVAPGIGDTVQPYTVVENGAALHLKALTAATNLTLANNLILSGLGVVHQFATNNGNSLSAPNPLGGPGQTSGGALLNLSGANTLTGNIEFNGPAGIGVEALGPNPLSQLILTGAMADYTPGLPFAPVLISPVAAVVGTDGIIKLGTQRLIIEGPGSYHGAVDIQTGVLLDQNNTGLGLGIDPTTGNNVATNIVTVETGAALELANTIATENGGISAGVQVHGSTLVLNGTGNNLFGDTAPLVVLPATPLAGPTATSPIGETITTTDDMWGGPVSIDQAIVVTFPSAQNLISSKNSLTGTGLTSIRSAPTTIIAGTATSTVQELTFSSNITGGSFTLSIDGVNFTTPIAWDPGTGADAGNLAARIQAALNALASAPNATAASVGASVNVAPNTRLNFTGAIGDSASPFVGGADFALSGGSGTTGAGEVRLAGASTYHGSTTVSQNIVLTLANSQALGDIGTPAPADANALVTSLNAEQKLDLTSLTAGATFTLTFSDATGAPASTPAATSLSLTGNAAADASKIQSQLTALANIGGANNLGGIVTVTPVGGSDKIYTVTFSGTLAGFNQNNLVVNLLTGGGAPVVTPLITGAGGTVVANGASLEFQGDIAVGGEPLLVMGGQGITATPTVPQQFFSIGSSPISGGFDLTTANVTGRVTGVAVDPSDPNVIYIATAGGGAWRTIDNGNTWHPIFDNVTYIDKVGVLGTAALYAGAITVDPVAPSTIYLGTGEADNSGDSYYGTGVYKSTDSGMTWTLLSDAAPNLGNNPLYYQAISKIVVDHAGSEVYVASSNQAQNTPINPVTGLPNVVAGIWRYDNTNTWVNISGNPDAVRLTDAGQIPEILPPTTPGPADDFRFDFPDGNNPLGTWSDLALDSTGTLYAALGTPSNGGATPFDSINNGIFRTPNPRFGTGVPGVGDFPTWYVGDPGPLQDEVQTITLTGGPLTLTFNGQSTGPIVPLTIANIESALNNLTTMEGLVANGGKPGAVQVTLVAFGPPAVFTVTFGTPNVLATPAGFPVPETVSGSPFFNAGINSSGGTPPLGVNNWVPAFASLGSPPIDLPNAFSDLPASLLGVTGGTVAITQQASGIDTRSVLEFPNNPGPGSPLDFGFPPIPPFSSNIKFALISGATANKDVIYAAITDPFTSGLKQIEKTIDGGLTWNPMAVQPQIPAGNPINYLGTQGDYDSTIVFDNINKLLYVGGQEDAAQANHVLQFSTATNGWTDLTVLPANGGSPHTDDHAMIMDTLGRLILGNDGGVWRWDPKAGSWSNINGNLAISQFDGIAADPTNPNIVLGGVQDNGVVLLNPALGPLWKDVSSGDGRAVAINPQNPLSMYAVINGGPPITELYQSANGGPDGFPNATGLPVNPFPGTTYPFVIDQINPPDLAAGTGRIVAATGVVRESVDGGNTFSNLIDQLPGFIVAVAIPQYQGTFVPDPGFPLVADVGIDTYDPKTIYATDGQGAEVTKDDAQLNVITGVPDWAIRDTGLPVAAGSAGAFSAFNDIEVDPRNRDTAFLVDSAPAGNDAASPSANGRVFMTTNAGLTWNNITGSVTPATYTTPGGLPDVPAWKLVIDPRNGNVYVGTDQGIFVSTNASSGGSSWLKIGAGLPEVNVDAMDLNQTTNILTVGSYGRSVFQIPLDGALTNPFNSVIPTSLATNPGVMNAVSGSSSWGGPVIFAGSSTIGAFGTQAIQNGIASASLTIGGSISDLSTASSNTITKVGLGNVIFSGSNIYGGVTDIKQGALIVQNSSALGSPTGATSVETGAALQMDSNLTGEPVTLFGDGISFDGHNTGALRNIGQNDTFTGTITLGSSATIGVDSGTTLIVTGTTPTSTGVINDTLGGVSQGFSLTKEETGTLILLGSDSYTGNTTINQGVLTAENNLALGMGSGATGTTFVVDGAQLRLQNPLEIQTLTLPTGVIAGTTYFAVSFGGSAYSAAIKYTSLGSDAFAVASALNSELALAGVGGSVQVFGANGIFSIFFTGNFGGKNFAQLGPVSAKITVGTPLVPVNTVANSVETIAGSPGIQLGYVTSTATQLVQSIELNGTGINGSGALVSVSGVNSISGNITLDTDDPGFAPATSPPLNIVISVLSSFEAGGVNGFLFPAPAGSLTLFGTILQHSPAQGFDKIGAGTLILHDNNTLGAGGYTGVTTVSGGILRIQNQTALASTSSTQVIPDLVDYPDGAELQLDTAPAGAPGVPALISNSPLVLTGSGINNSGSLENLSGYNTWNGPITLGSNTTVGVNQSTEQQVTVTGAAGTFTLTFTDANSPTNATTGALPFNAAAAQVQTALQLLLTTNLGLAGATVTVLPLDPNNPGVYTIIFGGTLDQTTQKTLIAAVAGGATAVVDLVKSGTTDALTLNPSTVGGIQDTNPIGSTLTKSGTGTLLLPTANSYGGQTLVTAGILDISNAGSLGTNPNTTVSNGASLELNAANGNFNVSTGTLKLNGNGLTPLTPGAPVGTYGVPLGALTNLIGANIWSTAVITLASNSAVGARAGSLTINSALVDGGSGFAVNVFGPGTVVFGGLNMPNTYTGNTTVTGSGVLQLNKTTSGAPANLIAVQGNLIIGDASKAATSTVQLTQPNQILSTKNVTVFGDGAFDLFGNNQTINNLTITGGVAGASSAGTVDLNSGNAGVTGTLTLTGSVTAASDNSAPANVAHIQDTVGGSNLNLVAGAGTTPFIVTSGGGTLAAGKGDLIVSAVLTGAGLTKTGKGILQLTNNDTLGASIVTQGALWADPGPNAALNTINAVTLNGGQLEGTGKVGAISTNPVVSPSLDVVSPGDNTSTFTGTAPNLLATTTGTPGILTATGSVTFNASTVFNVQLGGSVAGSGLAQLVVNGNVTLGNAILTGSLTNSFVPVIGSAPIVVLQVTGGNTLNAGIFANTNGKVLLNGLEFQITVNAGVNGTVTLTRIATGTTTTVVATGGTSGGTANFAQLITFTATVTPDLGAAPPNSAFATVTFTDTPASGPATALNTLAVIATPGATSTTYSITTNGSVFLLPGVHKITATFNDTSLAFSTSSGIVNAPANTFTVGNAVTTTTVTASVGAGNVTSYAFGQPVVFTATVSPTTATIAPQAVNMPTSLTIDKGTGHQLIVAGNTNLQLSGAGTSASTTFTPVINLLTPGNHTLEYDFPADTGGGAIYGASSGILNFTVTAAPTVTTVTNATTPISVGPSSNFGQQVTFTAQVTTSISGVPQTNINGTEPGVQGGTGFVQFFDNGNAIGAPQTVNDGSTFGLSAGTAAAQLTTSGTTLQVGASQLITAKYIPGTDPNFTASAVSAAFGFTVNKAPTVVLVTASDAGTAPPNNSNLGSLVTFTATVQATVNNGVVNSIGGLFPSGTLLFLDNGVAIAGTNTALTSGSGVATATFATNSMPAGVNNITAQFTSDTNFAASTAPGTPLATIPTVNKGNSTTSITGVTINGGGSGSVNITAHVASAPATLAAQFPPTPNKPLLSNVVFTDNIQGVLNVGGSAIDASGNVTLANVVLVPGNHLITATYSGDTNYNASPASSPATAITVLGGTSTTTITNVTPVPSVYGVNSERITATVAGVGGNPTVGTTVTFTDLTTTTTLGTANVVNAGGVYTATLISLTSTSLTGGGHSIQAVWAGDANFNGSTSVSTLVTITKNGTGTMVTSPASGASVSFGTPFTAVVTPSSSGAGTPSNTVTFTVTGGSFSSPQTFTVSLPAGSNVATLAPSLAPGTYSISAAYNGDGNFTNSNSTSSVAQGGQGGPVTNITVNRVTPSFTSVTGTSGSPSTSIVTLSPALVFGQPVVLTATLNSGGAPVVEGTVTFTDGGVTLGSASVVNGVAQLTTSQMGIPNLPVGASQTISTSYSDASGTGYNSIAIGPTVTPFTVNTANTMTTISSLSPNPSTIGQTVTLTAAVSATGASLATVNGGTVTFTENGSFLGTSSAVVSGSASITASFATVGAFNIVATYNGSAPNFAGSAPSATVVQHVASMTTTMSVAVLTSSPVFGQAVTVQATVTPSSGTLDTSIPVSFKDTFNGVTTTLGNGTLAIVSGKLVATFVTTTALSVGSHTITATYAGNASIVGSSNTASTTVAKAGTTTKLTSSATSTGFGQAVTFTATVTGAFPVAGTPPTGTVTFTDATTNTVLKTITLLTASNGVAVLSNYTGLAAGNHVITATYAPGTNPNFLASPASNSVTVAVSAPATQLGRTFTSSSTGAPISSIQTLSLFNLTVNAENSTGATVTSFPTSTATITVTSQPSAGAFTGTLTATMTNGVATFTNLRVTKAGSYTIVVSVGGLTETITFTTGGNIVG